MTRTQLLSHWLKARALYNKNKTRENLRLFMGYKAMLGWYDRRMFAYHNKSARVNRGVRLATRRATAHWLVVTSTTDGVHAPGSYHSPVNGVGRAADFGVPDRLVGTPEGRRRLVAFQCDEYVAWMKGKRPNMVELIGPDNNMVVLRGVHSPLPEGSPLENQHDNHVHAAYLK